MSHLTDDNNGSKGGDTLNSTIKNVFNKKYKDQVSEIIKRNIKLEEQDQKWLVQEQQKDMRTYRHKNINQDFQAI